MAAATGGDRNAALSRHGKIVAEVVSAKKIGLRQDRATLPDVKLAMAHFATDTGAIRCQDDAVA